MKWFRSNVKYGSQIALFALAIQLALSFGHFHGIADQAASVAQSGSARSELPIANNLATQTAHSVPAPASDHGPDDHQDDLCAICVVMALANTVLLATPPVVLQPDPVHFSYVTADAESVRVASVRVAFQPRAPPVS
jgi:hypothetical protein